MYSAAWNKNEQQQHVILSNQIINKNRNKYDNCNNFSMNHISENINRKGSVFSDGDTFHQNYISNMNNNNERYLTQTGNMRPSKHSANSNINGFHHVNLINQTDQQNELNHSISNIANIQNIKATTRSSTKAISLPSSHISRTNSETQLCKDIAAAEWHENCMFDRLVNGMREKQQARRLQRRNRSSSNNYSPFDTTDITTDSNSDRRIERSLENIVRHRYEDIPHVSSSPFEEDNGFMLDFSYGSNSSNFIEPDDEDSLVFDMDDL